MSSSSVDVSSYTKDLIFAIQKINGSVIPALIKHLSKSQHSIGQSIPDNNNNNSENNDGKNSSLYPQHPRLYGQLKKLLINLNYVQDAFDKLKKFEDHGGGPIKVVQQSVDDIDRIVTETPEGSFQADLVQTKLRKLNEIVTDLKLRVTSPHKISSASSETHPSPQSNPTTSGNGYYAPNVFDGLPNLHMNEQFRRSSAFKDIQEIYESLDITSKLCLSCFTAFPENEVVKKRVLIYWWIGEGLVVPPKTSEKTADDIAEDVFKELMVKGFIEPVNKKCRLITDSFKMDPFIRSAVIMLAQEDGFFDFDSKGTPTANFSSCHRACLVKSEGGSSQQVSINSPDLDQGELHTLFNVSERYLGFQLEWFLKMKNVNVLYLGRWQSSAEHHIEVEDTEFLKGLKNMKQLKLISLQGISRITELPDSISKLTNLRILDLGACHNLEVIPDGIGSLKNLTHLDMSECYLLDHMPKGLASLLELQVLKGFVIGDPRNSPCTLDDLVNLKKLKKLSISTSRGDFPTDRELNAFQPFTALSKLTIAWGGSSVQAKSDNSAKQESGTAEPVAVPSTEPRIALRLPTLKRDTPVIAALPTSLEKLDLQCIPWSTTPNWLMPGKLKKLEKLYIRGGKLHSLGQVQAGNDGGTWTVKTLRMKFLHELEMNWEKLQELFPDVIYLEKVECPKLASFQCDESTGVWLKENNETKAVATN